MAEILTVWPESASRTLAAQLAQRPTELVGIVSREHVTVVSWPLLKQTQRFCTHPAPLWETATPLRSGHIVRFVPPRRLIQSRNFRTLARASFAAPRASSARVIVERCHTPDYGVEQWRVAAETVAVDRGARVRVGATREQPVEDFVLVEIDRKVQQCGAGDRGPVHAGATLAAAALRRVDLADRESVLEQTRSPAQVLSAARCHRDGTPSSACRAGRNRAARGLRASRACPRDAGYTFRAPSRAAQAGRHARP